MSKEATKALFQKTFSDHILLNFSEEEECSIPEWYKLGEPTPTARQLESKLQPSPHYIGTEVASSGWTG